MKTATFKRIEDENGYSTFTPTTAGPFLRGMCVREFTDQGSLCHFPLGGRPEGHRSVWVHNLSLSKFDSADKAISNLIALLDLDLGGLVKWLHG